MGRSRQRLDRAAAIRQRDRDARTKAWDELGEWVEIEARRSMFLTSAVRAARRFDPAEPDTAADLAVPVTEMIGTGMPPWEVAALLGLPEDVVGDLLDVAHGR